MPHPPRLIAELLALTRPWGWTLKDLARELGISEVTLGQLRSGRRRVSFTTYSRIVDRFGDNAIIKGVAWQHARDYHKPEDESPVISVPANLPAAATNILQRYVAGFAEGLEHVRTPSAVLDLGTGAGGSAALVATRFPDASVVAAADRRAALVVPLLIIERVEFLHPVVADLLRQRDDILRPVVVTSTTEPAAATDDYLRRVFLSRMRRVDLAPLLSTPSISPTALHAQQ